MFNFAAICDIKSGMIHQLEEFKALFNAGHNSNFKFSPAILKNDILFQKQGGILPNC